MRAPATRSAHTAPQYKQYKSQRARDHRPAVRDDLVRPDIDLSGGDFILGFHQPAALAVGRGFADQRIVEIDADVGIRLAGTGDERDSE